ncbi:alpha/beta fold hydrolase [Nonomuraea sp. NPDC049709]|uniref:serine aminopeptidase domain-containing protein n=1 Tax=Nonomuraea sp. NPDC049709 TaxID=3154736 RepID=UPI003444877D
MALPALLAVVMFGAQAGYAAPAMISTSVSAAVPVLSLPRPTGQHPVGVRSDSVTDPARMDEETGRPRRLPVRIWYPAVHSGPGPSAPYVSPAIRAYLERSLSLPAGLLDIDTHASPDVRPRRDIAGVVIVQHGGGLLAAFQTGQVIDLASRGYAVVTMDHPHESLVVEEPDGRLISGTDPETHPFQERVLDAATVLGALSRLVPEAGHRTPIAMIGHSRGGAAAAETMLHHPQIVAGVDLDGSPRGEVLLAGLDQPFGLMLSSQQPLEGNALLAQFLGNLRGPHPVRELAILHYGYTDWVVFNPQATRADPATGALLEGYFSTGTADDLRAGHRALAAQRKFVARFIQHHLGTARTSAQGVTP